MDTTERVCVAALALLVGFAVWVSIEATIEVADGIAENKAQIQKILENMPSEVSDA